MSSLDYYQILNIAEDASDQDIKKAYRKLALKYHPDKNSSADAAEKFKEISEAYEILSDPEKRGVYDNRGAYDDYAYDYNPFAEYMFHDPADIFNQMYSMFGFDHMMHPPFPHHHPPPPPPPPHPMFGGGSHQHPFFQPPFGNLMSPPFGMNPFQHNMNTNFSFNSSNRNMSSGSTSRGGSFSSKSVSTSTHINSYGEVETRKVTTIVDENGTQVTEEFGDGRVIVNGIEQPPSQHQIENSSGSKKVSNNTLAGQDIHGHRDDNIHRQTDYSEIIRRKQERLRRDISRIEDLLYNNTMPNYYGPF